MKNLLCYCFYGLLFIGFLTACSQSATTQKKVTGNIGFETTSKSGGTAFYAIDAQTGQLSYMLDVGEDAGNWRKYGNPYRKSSTEPMYFRAIERGPQVGTSFYILNGNTGQIGYLLDYGPGAGTWTEFGELLRNANITDFEAKLVGGNIVFYAFDGVAKQVYFMQDFGDKLGKWQKYGTDNN